MFFEIICVIYFANSVLSRNVPSFKDLDEEDQMLFRAAYDIASDHEPSSYNHEKPYNPTSYNHETYIPPSYNQETPSYKPPLYNYADYQHNELPLSKLDLLKDGMWALKAKMKELKAFNKALAANLLSTKLKVKELMEHMKPLKKHQHVEVEKPVYYQPQPPQSYPQYEPPHKQYNSGPASSPHYTAQHYQTTQQEYDPYYGQ